ncbi:MAG: hypothetical protein J7K00_02250 [Candidatus Diapherotrites archaeon]|nr:hypothetical protein [Candidatus Diapherotrites archaeon]
MKKRFVFVLSAVFVLMFLSFALSESVREWSASEEEYRFRSEGKTFEAEFLFEDISDHIQIDALVTDVYLERITETEGALIEFNQTICYAPIGEKYSDCLGLDIETDVLRGTIHEEFYPLQSKSYSYNKGITGERGTFFVDASEGLKVKVILTSLTDDDFKLIEQNEIYPDNNDDPEDDVLYTIILWVRGETIHEPETDLYFQEYDFDGNVSTEFTVPIRVVNDDPEDDIKDVEISFDKTGCVILDTDDLFIFDKVSANNYRKVDVQMRCDEPGTYFLNNLKMSFLSSEDNLFEKQAGKDKNVTIVIPEPPKPVILTKITKVSVENEYPIRLDFSFKNEGDAAAKSIAVVENSDLIDFEEISVTTHSVSPGETVTFSVKVVPLKDKVELVDSISVEFEDLSGNKYSLGLPPLIVNYEKIEEIKAGQIENPEEEQQYIPPLQTFLVKNESNIPLFLIAVLLAFVVYAAYEKKKKQNPTGLNVFR